MNPTTEQRAVIESSDRQILVIAGPGSGKTATIVKRYAHRVRSGLENPARTVFVTFTVAMARELRERIAEEAAPQPLYIGTLHGLAYQILGRGVFNAPDIVDSEERETIVKEVARSMAYKNPPIGAILDAVVKPQGIRRHGRDAQVARTLYEKALASEGLIDFDLMVPRAIESLKTHPMPVQALYVDEFQDTNPHDLAFYRAIEPEVFVAIGDPDQAIYGFRGASDLAIREVAGESITSLLTLTQSFRVPVKVAAAANSMMRRHPGRLVAKDITTKKDSGAVAVLGYENEVAEAQALCETIKALLYAEIPPDQIAVLCRYTKQVEGFEAFLRAMLVPVAEKRQAASPEEFVLAVLRAWTNPTMRSHDRLRVLSGKAPVNGPGWYISAIPQIDITKVSLINTLKAMAVPLPTIAWAAGILEDCDGNPKQAMAAIAELIHNKAAFDVSEGITVCTMHAAKGREFDAVIMPAFEQELIPRTTDPARLIEERRLAFVAATRAKEKLVITYSLSRSDYMGKSVRPASPSQFIAEMGLLAKPGAIAD